MLLVLLEVFCPFEASFSGEGGLARGRKESLVSQIPFVLGELSLPSVDLSSSVRSTSEAWLWFFRSGVTILFGLILCDSWREGLGGGVVARKSGSSGTGCRGALVGEECENKDAEVKALPRLFSGVKFKTGNCNTLWTVSDHYERRFVYRQAHLVVILHGRCLMRGENPGYMRAVGTASALL